MDARTVCALMLKAKKVFDGEHSFLSFPISPLPFAPKQLDFFDQSSPPALLESTHRRRDFSMLVDLVPSGEAWQPSGDARLSDIYDTTLDTLELASSDRTPDEEARFQAARSVLRNGDHESDKLIAYRQRRDAFIVASERFTAARLTAMNAGPTELAQWQNTTEPALRRELAELEQAWILDGFKEEVEAAQQQVATLGARSPAQTWAEWRSHFNRDIDGLTDPLDNVSVMPSGFSPANAVAQGAWHDFSLTPAEIAALLREAPPAWLETMLGSPTPTPPPQGTQSLAFQFSSAGIVRPWFDAALFKARFWRFAQADRQLCDGKSPASGECPAYVAAVVFARNVVVTDTAQPAPGTFDGFRFTQATKLARSNIIKRRALTPLNDPELQPGEIPPHLLKPKVGVHAIGRVRPMAASGAGMLRTSPAAVAVAVAPPLAVPVAAADPARTLLRFEHLKVDRIPDIQPETPIDAEPAGGGGGAPAAPVSGDTIFVLAFICKSLQRCPDPDLALKWS